MIPFRPFTLNLHGRLREFHRPQVMGIVNVTPDSFYEGSRTATRRAVEARVAAMLAQGADMIDVGGYSSRPGALEVSEAEELRRVEVGLEAVRAVSADVPVSVDTFRSGVARRAVATLGADIVNDISGGLLDREMTETVATLHAPYILMHMRGTPSTMQNLTEYGDVTAEVLAETASRLQELEMAGVCDVIVDPGFGFAKTLDQNYELLGHLGAFGVLGRPLLVGMSRKSMLTGLLGISTEEALEATTAVNTAALLQGAAILRVHDVLPAVQTVAITSKINRP